MRKVFEETVNAQDWTAACELNFLDQLKIALNSNGYASSATTVSAATVRSALVFFRDQNWIDDVILGPLIAFYPAWSEQQDQAVSRPTTGCPSDDLLNIFWTASAQFGRKMNDQHLLAAIDATVAPPVTSDPARVVWLKALGTSDYQYKTTHSFRSFFESLSTAKDSVIASTTSSFLTLRRKKLYDQYSGLQIAMLSDVFAHFTKRMLADSAEIRIQFQDKTVEDDVLSPQEQYRMSAKMFHKDVEELKISTLFAGTSPTVEDVISAGIETGFIASKDVDAAMAVQELWNPKLPRWVKTYKIIERFGFPALLFIPAPGNIIASLAVAIVDAFALNKYKNNVPPVDRGISIF